MARFNEQMHRNPARRYQAERRESLERLGVDVTALAAELGVGERRAMAEAERQLNIHWHAGTGDGGAGHRPGRPK